MSDQIKQVAARIKELRDISGTSLETMAREFGISKSTYEAYESGSTDIPVGFLYELASRFDVELTALLTGENPRLRTYALVRKGAGVSVERRKEYKYQSLAFNFAHKKMEPFLVRVDPSPETEPVSLNSHPGQEFNYVLEGMLKIVIDDHDVVLATGDSLFFDSALRHGMKAMKNKPAAFLAVIA